MYSFLLDAWAAIRLRFFTPDHYRYNIAVVCGILLAMGAVNAATMALWFGNSNGAVAFILCITILKWLVLSLSMNSVLHYYGSPKINWFGYILLTEALAIPLIAVIYFPAILAIPAPFWTIWIALVQLIGLMKLSGQNMLKIILAYIVYGIIMLLIASLLANLFAAMGWLDPQSIMKQMQSTMDTEINQ